MARLKELQCEGGCRDPVQLAGTCPPAHRVALTGAAAASAEVPCEVRGSSSLLVCGGDKSPPSTPEVRTVAPSTSSTLAPALTHPKQVQDNVQQVWPLTPCPCVPLKPPRLTTRHTGATCRQGKCSRYGNVPGASNHLPQILLVTTFLASPHSLHVSASLCKGSVLLIWPPRPRQTLFASSTQTYARANGNAWNLFLST